MSTTESGSGGIVGCIVGKGSSSIENSWFKGTAITNGNHCGGIAGASGLAGDTTATISIVISNCLNEGSVSGNGKIGGLLGRAVDIETVIRDCLNVGLVSATTTSTSGSVVGESSKPCKIEDVHVLDIGKDTGTGSHAD